MEQALTVVFIANLAWIAWDDFKTRRIANKKVFFLLLTGFLYQMTLLSYSGIFTSLMGLFVGFALLFLPYRLGAMGAGDVKFLAAIGAFTGSKSVIMIFLISAVIGGVYSVLAMIRQGTFRKSIQGIKHRLVYAACAQKLPNEGIIQFSEKSVTIPYGVSLALGTVGYLFWGGGFYAF